MMLGEKVAAPEAERIGMIYKIFKDDVFLENAINIARFLADMPTKGLAFTKQALNMSFTSNFDEQLNDEDILQQKAAATKDYREGVTAFMEKRKPGFTGE